MNLKISIFVLFSIFSISVYAQPSNLIFYTNNVGHKFQLFINGERQNDDFEQTVRMENMEARNYQIKVIFEDRMLGFIEKDIFLRPNTEKMYSFSNQRVSTTRRVGSQVQNTSPLRLDMLSEAPLNSVDDVYLGESNDSNDAIDYTTTESPGNENSIEVKYDNGNVVIGNDQNNISVGKNGIDVNFDVEKIINKINSENSNEYPNQTEVEENTTEFPTSEITNVSTLIETNSCTPSFTDHQFNLIIQSLQTENIESKRLAKAKRVAFNNCLLTKQVRDVVALFNFENNRVEFAKFAYKFVSDKENYALLLDSFKFLTSKQEIREYINE